jgi:MFS family permease
MTRRQFALLVPPILTTFMAIMDVSVVSVVLPKIQTERGGGVAAAQWVVDVYALMLCGLSLSGGAIADRYGRKRLLLVGILVLRSVRSAAHCPPTWACWSPAGRCRAWAPPC